MDLVAEYRQQRRPVARILTGNRLSLKVNLLHAQKALL